MLEMTTETRRRRPWHVYMPDEERPADQAACQARRTGFGAKYGVRRKRRTRSPDVRSVVYSGGADLATRREAIDLMFPRTFDGWIESVKGDNDILDHAESWRRGGRSLFLIAHPYGYSDATRFTCDGEPRIRHAASRFLAGAAMAGLTAWLNPPSAGWYGYNSHQIVICNPESVERFTGVAYDPVGYRMPVPPDDAEPCRLCGEPWGRGNGDLVWLGGGPGWAEPEFAPACKDCSRDNRARAKILAG